MGSAYTPGLQVSPLTIVRRRRRLPIQGEVLSAVSDRVQPDTIVARALLPGIIQTVKVAAQLDMEPSELSNVVQVKPGDTVESGQVMASSRSLFGLFRSEVKSPVAGTVESISSVTGNVGIRVPPRPIDLTAYLQGVVVEVMDREGVVVEVDAALIQGIFGVGGERVGEIAVVTANPDEPLTASAIKPHHAGKILVGGGAITGEALLKASQAGVVGLIAGGVVDRDLTEFLGYDIGVAITGQENISVSLMVTEGFGNISMAGRTFELLKSLDGRQASMNGATQIRAGVIRPEIIVPRDRSEVAASPETAGDVLDIGVPIRIIREPYFGRLARVSALPSELVEIESGASVRVLNAELSDGTSVTVPRANVEIIKAG